MRPPDLTRNGSRLCVKNFRIDGFRNNCGIMVVRSDTEHLCVS